MRQIGPKNRIARREGVDLGLKTPGTKSHARLLKKLNILPGQHGTRTRRKFSERGRQLRETQKLKSTFGLSTKQLKKYFKNSVKKPGNTASFLINFLEKRLDNIVFRLGFAPTRAAARQLINHKHIKLNDQLVNIPSCEVKINNVVTFCKEKSLKIPDVQKSIERKDFIIPAWLEKKAIAGKLVSEPTADLVDKQVNLRLVIEYFSR